MEPEHYVGHLVALAAEQRVEVERDLTALDGQVVVARGETLEAETLDALRGQRISDLGVRSFVVGDPIDPGSVLNVWSRLREEFRDLEQTERRMGIEDDFEAVARKAPIPPAVWQVASVLFSRRPDWFRHAVFGAWWAVAIAREAGLVDVDVLRAYAASFTRDFGFLFIDARHVDRPGYLEGGTMAWRAIQSHVDIGRQIWLESDAPPPWAAAVGQAIFEHHERINAIGYPDRLPEDVLDPVGQVVGMSDLLSSVRLKRFRDSGRNMKDAAPLLMVSADCFQRPVIDAAVRVLDRSGLRGTTVSRFGSKADLVDHLLSRAHLIRRLTLVLQELPSFEPVLGRGQPRPPPSPMTRAVTSTIQMLLRSGSNQTELAVWLDQVGNGRSTARMHELCEMELQQEEALFRVEQIRRLLAEHVEAHRIRSGSTVERVLNQLRNPMSI